MGVDVVSGRTVSLPIKRNPAHEALVVDAAACPRCGARRAAACRRSPSGEACPTHAARYAAAVAAGVTLRRAEP